VPGWLLIAVAVLTAAALVVVGVLLARPSNDSVASDTTAAQAAAERAVVPILSYDAHHLDRSQAAATPYLTQDYRTQYDKLFAVIRDNAPKTGTVVRAKYLASGVVRSGAGRVDVLVFVNQVTFNKQHPKTPVIYKNQATVTMEKVGNDWLVDNMVTSQQGS
jgi:Mce-associated membrane protein